MLVNYKYGLFLLLVQVCDAPGDVSFSKLIIKYFVHILKIKKNRDKNIRWVQN